MSEGVTRPLYPAEAGTTLRPVVAAAPSSLARRLASSAAVRVLAVYAASRLVVVLAVGTVVLLNNGMGATRFAGPWPAAPAAPKLLQALGSYDGAWYVFIASHGYFTSIVGFERTQAFFPSLPALMRAGSAVIGVSTIEVGSILAFVFGALAAVALWYLVRDLCDEAVAHRAVALWVFFPGSFVLSMIYAEGLTVLCCAVCLLALHRRYWLLAGVAAGIATGTQPEALALVPCCIWAAAVGIYRDRRWMALAAPVLSVAGVAAYFVYLYHRTGDLLRWYHVEQTVWASGNGFGHNTVDLLSSAFRRPTFIHDSVPAAFLLLAVVGLVLMVRWRPPVIIWLFTAGVLLSAVSSFLVGTRGRVILVAFPLIIAIARVARRRVFETLLGCAGCLLGLLTIITLTQVLVAP